MKLAENTRLRLTSKSVAYAGLGVASLALFAASVLTLFNPEGLRLALWLFMGAAGSGVAALVLNALWVRRIASGAAGNTIWRARGQASSARHSPACFAQ